MVISVLKKKKDTRIVIVIFERWTRIYYFYSFFSPPGKTLLATHGELHGRTASNDTFTHCIINYTSPTISRILRPNLRDTSRFAYTVWSYYICTTWYPTIFTIIVYSILRGAFRWLHICTHSEKKVTRRRVESKIYFTVCGREKT